MTTTLMLILYMGHGVTSQIVDIEECKMAKAYEAKSVTIECIPISEKLDIDCN